MEQANLVSLRRKTRYTAVFLGLLLALCAIAVLNINIGSVPISVGEIAKIIFTKTGDPTQVNIIWKIRAVSEAISAGCAIRKRVLQR